MAGMASLAANERAEIIERVQKRANWIRRRSLQMVFEARQGHPGGDLSAADILASLYFHAMRYDSAHPHDPMRDRFVMSKGHCSGSLYATLAAAGFFPMDDLSTYMQPLSKLNGHPNRNYVSGVEANTGPLGHGLPVALGMAIAGQIDRAPFRVFVLTGDGELQEGSNWEAAMTAGHRAVSNLTLIVDRNRLQQGAAVEDTVGLEPLGDKFRAFGWGVEECDGHDVSALCNALERPSAERAKPRCVIANTIKGKGVSFMEDQLYWHHGVPNAEQYAQAMQELGA
jgi:transketolase